MPKGIRQITIHRRKKKDGGCTFYHNTMLALHSSAHKQAQGKPYFCNICRCAEDILYVTSEYFANLISVHFMSVVKVFIHHG